MRRQFSIFVAAAATVIAVPAAAQSNDPAPYAIVQPVEVGAEADAFGGSTSLGEGDLQSIAGREDVGAMIATANQRNTVSNNSVTGASTTGNVQIDGNAFQNLQGLAVISANSGNNVAINSAMNVTISLSAPQ